MGTSSAVNQSGLRDSDINIDGTAIAVPGRLEVHNLPILALSQALSGGQVGTVPYHGDALPDQPDLFEFLIDWELSDSTSDQQTALAALEQLRTQGGVHTLAFWKFYRYTYSGKAGQQVFYLPRPDSFSKAYSGKTAQATYGATISTPDHAPYALAKTAYKASVVSTDVVTADEAWISKTTIVHPDSGRSCALFKLGTGLSVAGSVVVDFIPLFNVLVTGVPTQPFDRPRREDKSLYLTESA